MRVTFIAIVSLLIICVSAYAENPDSRPSIDISFGYTGGDSEYTIEGLSQDNNSSNV